jgi:hypothetical protein
VKSELRKLPPHRLADITGSLALIRYAEREREPRHLAATAADEKDAEHILDPRLEHGSLHDLAIELRFDRAGVAVEGRLHILPEFPFGRREKLVEFDEADHEAGRHSPGRKQLRTLLEGLKDESR